jgi:hypothetical protein
MDFYYRRNKRKQTESNWAVAKRQSPPPPPPYREQFGTANFDIDLTTFTPIVFYSQDWKFTDFETKKSGGRRRGRMIWYTQVDDEIFDSKNMIASLYSSPHLTG